MALRERVPEELQVKRRVPREPVAPVETKERAHPPLVELLERKLVAA